MFAALPSAWRLFGNQQADPWSQSQESDLNLRNSTAIMRHGDLFAQPTVDDPSGETSSCIAQCVQCKLCILNCTHTLAPPLHH